MKKYVLFSLCVFLFPVVTHAGVVSFEENYVYDASEADSMITCRAISLLQVKRLLLERLGTYLESKKEIVNNQLTKDEIITLSAGIVKTEILQEEWNGKTYSLTARIEADPDGVAQALDMLRQDGKGENKIKKLETNNEKLIDKINELKRELARVQENLILINRDFSKSSKIINSWESFENGLVLLNRGKYKKAITAFDRAIEQNPKYMHFFSKGYRLHENEAISKCN
jgi:tetratricopeptide (TPR) repeat protein